MRIPFSAEMQLLMAVSLLAIPPLATAGPIVCIPAPGTICDNQTTMPINQGNHVQQIHVSDFVRVLDPTIFGPGVTATILGSLGGGNRADVFSFTISFPGTYLFDIDLDGIPEADRSDLFLTLFVEPLDGPPNLPNLIPVAWSDDAGSDPGSENSIVDPFIGEISLHGLSQNCGLYDDCWSPGTYYIVITHATQYPVILNTTPDGGLQDLSRPDGEFGGYRALFPDESGHGGGYGPTSLSSFEFFGAGQPQTAGFYTLYITRLDDPELPKPPTVDPEPSTWLLMLSGAALIFHRVRNRKFSL